VPVPDTHAVRRTWRLGRLGRLGHAVDLRIAAGLVGLGTACALRVALAGVAGARSVTAGLIFGAVVAAVAAAISVRTVPAHSGRFAVLRLLTYGVLGAIALCVPAALRHADSATVPLPLNGYLPWALGVVVVAIAEESLLRGSLFTALQQRGGTASAIVVTSVAFAVLHVPLYGTSVFPLDLAVGVWLGALRASTGSVAVPAVAHTLADLAGWWLR
jgi:membrane protease YdiL (CAAX protease family)